MATKQVEIQDIPQLVDLQFTLHLLHHDWMSENKVFSWNTFLKNGSLTN